ncbi:HI0074 family nucleotidyltransferase substrate-binding subunit [Zunongwangia sp. H14]|uniref:HI0074 family nucleotidyltransferase substrate-binding subunit n=1 Tax=Zunongwangia sp. H14 TaxID=3240792 RepID=UPI0035650DA1
MEQIRWQQRFSNLTKAFHKLERGLELFNFEVYLEKRQELKENIDSEKEHYLMLELEQLDLDREGIIQRFEYTYELFLNTIKDFMEYHGEPRENFKGSRTILSLALQKNIIEDHDKWRKMVQSRNDMSHTYNEEVADEVTSNIIDIYFPLMQKLYGYLKKEYEK